MRYRRANVAGGTYFFTVNLAERSADTLARHIDGLREVMHKVKESSVEWCPGIGVSTLSMVEVIMASGETLGFLRQPNLRAYAL